MPLIRRLLAVAALVAVLATHVGFTPAAAGARVRGLDEQAARAVARAFFRSINAREFTKTCDLLSAGYYEVNHIPDRTQCAWRLTLGFAWQQEIRFQIRSIRMRNGRALVSALADGVPGTLLIGSGGGAFKILGVNGS
jgi:hypothetical protein